MRNELSRLVQRSSELIKQRGIVSTFKQAADKLIVYGQCPLKKLSYSRESFRYGDKQLNYAVHSYNATWRNERGIEVPVMLDFLREHAGSRILELGNVSRYYGDFSHDVIDKYEQSPNIINKDIIDFEVKEPYDAFISISTIEHIGWDEATKDSDKILRMFKKLGEIVRDHSKVLISFPTGYNDHLDAHLAAGRLPFQNIVFLKRIDSANHWQECDQSEALSLKYNSLFPAANAVAFGTGLKI